MEDEVKVYEFEISGERLLHQQFVGQEETRALKALPDKERAEALTYKDDKGRYGMPNTHVRGSVVEEMVNRAPKNMKKTTKERVSPRIVVEPSFLVLSPQKYVINRRGIKVEQGGKVSMDFVVQPEFRGWSVKGLLKTTLDDDMRKWLELAGMEVGVGTNRINGYGRFKVASFKRVTNEV